MQAHLLVAFGGAVGSLARYAVGAWVKAREWTGFPWATFGVNVVGSLVLGVLAAMLVEKGDARQTWFLLLGTGFCGGFTTFSTFELDLLLLLREGEGGKAALYVVGSVMVGLLGVWVGFELGDRLS